MNDSAVRPPGDTAGAPHADGMLMLEGLSELETRSVRMGGGTLIAYTCRCPGKTTDNEDTVAAIPYGPDAAVLVVADGAGGLPAGRRASRTAVTTLEKSLQTSMSETTLLRTAILTGIERANKAVLELGTGSATTLTVVTVEGKVARSYQIGDSEAIVMGLRGKVKAQTLAHSPTGFAVEAGFLDQREALHHEERHLVSNLLGSNDMRIDVGATVELSARDTILLASDGLTDNIHIEEIVELVRKGPLSAALDSLVKLAQRRMTVEAKTLPSKPDDLSVILFRKTPRPRKKRPAAPARL